MIRKGMAAFLHHNPTLADDSRQASGDRAARRAVGDTGKALLCDGFERGECRRLIYDWANGG